MWVSPHLLKCTIYFVGSGGQLSRVFDLRPLSYLDHKLKNMAWHDMTGRGGKEGRKEGKKEGRKERRKEGREGGREGGKKEINLHFFFHSPFSVGLISTL